VHDLGKNYYFLSIVACYHGQVSLHRNGVCAEFSGTTTCEVQKIFSHINSSGTTLAAEIVSSAKTNAFAPANWDAPDMPVILEHNNLGSKMESEETA